MTDDSRSIGEIEADLERHRAELTYNIDLLQSKLSVDGAVRQIKQLAGDNLSDVSAGISRMVRTNPLAVALIGIGIVWLASGRTASLGYKRRHTVPNERPVEPIERWFDDGGPAWDDPEETPAFARTSDHHSHWADDRIKDI